MQPGATNGMAAPSGLVYQQHQHPHPAQQINGGAAMMIQPQQQQHQHQPQQSGPSTLLNNAYSGGSSSNLMTPPFYTNVVNMQQQPQQQQQPQPMGWGSGPANGGVSSGLQQSVAPDGGGSNAAAVSAGLSAEEVGLSELEGIVAKLDLTTMRNIKESMHRLARSARVRGPRGVNDGGGGSAQQQQGGPGHAPPPADKSQSLVDRCVANLLYHRYTDNASPAPNGAIGGIPPEADNGVHPNNVNADSNSQHHQRLITNGGMSNSTGGMDGGSNSAPIGMVPGRSGPGGSRLNNGGSAT